jgi:hypothetical protein
MRARFLSWLYDPFYVEAAPEISSRVGSAHPSSTRAPPIKNDRRVLIDKKIHKNISEN